MEKVYQWAVMGAGPGGIAAVGELIDRGVEAQHILWIDPEFKVGDLGKYWQPIPSNTRAGLFLDFLNACESFNFSQAPSNFALQKCDTERGCLLGNMAECLQWVSEHLKKQVSSRQGLVSHLQHQQGNWQLQLGDDFLLAKKVILANGAEPKVLTYRQETIPLRYAMDRQGLSQYVNKDDCVALFGSSHSAVLALRALLENKVGKIINFYRSPLRYAVYMDDWILFDNTGLKGETAEWARANIDVGKHANLTRALSNVENIETYLPSDLCCWI